MVGMAGGKGAMPKGTVGRCTHLCSWKTHARHGMATHASKERGLQGYRLLGGGSEKGPAGCGARMKGRKRDEAECSEEKNVAISRAWAAVWCLGSPGQAGKLVVGERARRLPPGR